MIKRLFIGALVVSALAASPAHAQRRARTPAANPSAVIAAETAFARQAKEKGQWTAYRANAARQAVMFVPQMVLAADWLKDRVDPAQPVTWQPHIVWSSCDGSLVASHGAWQNGPSRTGYFTTLWQRQKKGEYRWVFQHGDMLAFPLDPPEMIAALVAECPDRDQPRPKKKKDRDPDIAWDPAQRSGQSDDGTLAWEVTVTPDGARNLSVNWRKDGTMGPALIEAVEAPQPAARR